MFPWQNVFGGDKIDPWTAWTLMMDSVYAILGWDVVRGTLAVVAACVFIAYIVYRLRRIAGV